jgi:hypothetical protein
MSDPAAGTSLRELFADNHMVEDHPKGAAGNRPVITYTKNPVLNRVLNETTSKIRSRDRVPGTSMGVSPSLVMLPDFNMARALDTAEVSEPSFMRQIPPMGHPISEVASSQPSVLDIADQIPAPAVRNALTRNYSQMMKIIDQKRKKI